MSVNTQYFYIYFYLKNAKNKINNILTPKALGNSLKKKY